MFRKITEDDVRRAWIYGLDCGEQGSVPCSGGPTHPLLARAFDGGWREAHLIYAGIRKLLDEEFDALVAEVNARQGEEVAV